jgi:PiT family inorganic phosphate transporter
MTFELVLFVIFVALVFEYINGFHDTANSIATVVATKVLTAKQAIAMAAIFNLIGALCGTAVAATIGKGLVDTGFVNAQTLLCGLLAGIIWNLITWWYGLPSSSSHALIGGLVGSTLAAASGDWGVINFISTTGDSYSGLLPKVLIPMILSPIIGLCVAYQFMNILHSYLIGYSKKTLKRLFVRLQVVSSASMAFSHGLNDAQKTMGIITLLLLSAAQTGALQDLPSIFSFMNIGVASGNALAVPVWVKILCAVTMAAGTWAGGWRIIRTLGRKLVSLRPVSGFVAETSATLVIQISSAFGIPLSTTHVISSAIIGVGVSKGRGRRPINLTILRNMLLAWVTTMPICALIAYLLVRLFG